MFDLSGKTALVTGGSYGLGVVFAHALADQGADIVLTARSADLLEKEAGELAAKGVKCTWYPGDVTSMDDVARVVASAVGDHGGIDILVNNAGVSDLSGLPSEHWDDEMFKRVIDVDLIGVWNYAREVGRHMLEKGRGSIVNIASILGEGGSEYVTPAYHAAKGAVLQLTRHLAVEWADRNVRVNAISPAFFVTDMVRPLFESLGMQAWMESRTPMRRLGEAADLVGPIVFLASDESSYVTGVNLAVDGGVGASRGAWQIDPPSREWNKDRPPIGDRYKGLVELDREQFDAWFRGVPGIHH